MLNWLKQILSNLRSMRITLKRIREAYLQRDTKYLKKAYKYGKNYLKRTVVGYLGEIPTQENFDFLINEMNTIQDIQLKSYIYASIMNIALNKNIEITDSESEFLNQNYGLLDNIGYVTTKPKKLASKPITFRSRWENHLKMLEEKKKDFEGF